MNHSQLCPPLPCMVSGRNDVLIDADGRQCIDLFSGHGTVWLGHANPEIADEVVAQAAGIWNVGGLPAKIHTEAQSLIESFFPKTHYPAALYSTGTDAAEFALRLARMVTQKTGAVGFAKNFHGKSLATAQLGWDNTSAPLLREFHRLPFGSSVAEGEVLERLETTLKSGTISAVFVEPIQGSGGYSASISFYEQVLNLCRDHGALSVFDEILTGFYRTGPPFFFSRLQKTPDVVLIGKSMGNGFPVSGVVVDRRHPIQGGMLPGSTFGGNLLAAAAIRATLRQMRTMDLTTMVAALEQVIVTELAPLVDLGIALRGKGALWVIELPPAFDGLRIAHALYQRGVLVSHTGNILRILPAATIELDHLKRACAILADELTKACHDQD